MRMYLFHLDSRGHAAILVAIGTAVAACSGAPESNDPSPEVGSVQQAISANASVVISQVYGGGQSAGATYNYDYVEILNRGTHPVSLSGWSIQYGSVVGVIGSSGAAPLPNIQIFPNKYLLLQMAGNVGAPPIAADVLVSPMISMSAINGKVALLDQTARIMCSGSTTAGPSACTTDQMTHIIDLVGYGTMANAFEGTAPVANLSITTSAQRFFGGCTDTNSNGADFVVAAPFLRNSTFPTFPPCNVAGTTP